MIATTLFRFCGAGLLCLCWSEKNAAVVSAATYSQPDEISSVNGKLAVTLDLNYAVTLDGRRISAVYNGKPIGPTLRVSPGDTVSVTLKNSLPPVSDLDRELYAYTHDKANEQQVANFTSIYNRLSLIGNVNDPSYGFWGLNYANLHFHGADVALSVEKNHNAVGGGESVTYNFTIPMNQERGLMWYHHHYHGVVATSYMGGQYGFFLIEGTDDDITGAPGIQGATEVFMMLSEFLPANSSLTPSPPLPFFPIVMSFDWIAITNGEDGDSTQYVFDQGELVLFRVGHAGVEPTIRIDIRDHTMTIVGYDGFPLPEPMEVETVVIGSGQRVEFLVRFSTPGNFTMTRQPWNIGITGVGPCTEFFNIPAPKCISYDIEKTVVHIQVMGSSTQVQAMEAVQLPPYNKYHQDLAAMTPAGKKTIRMVQDMDFPIFQIPYDGPFVPPGTGFGMNGRLFTPFYSHGNVTAGTCETWDIIASPPNSEHTFHVHASDFLVTHENGVAVEKPYWRDTLIIYENATIHVCFDRVVPGDHLLFHCHMPSHQDIGMAGQYLVVAAPTSAPTMVPTEAPATSGANMRAYTIMALSSVAFAGFFLSMM